MRQACCLFAYVALLLLPLSIFLWVRAPSLSLVGFMFYAARRAANCSLFLFLLHQLVLCFALIVKYEFHPPSCVLSLLRRCLCCRARRYSCCATLIMIWYGNHNYIYIYNIYINIYIYILYAVVVLLVLVVRHTHDLHKCYLRGHFRCFFSRYPSVALASNNVLRVLEPQPVSRSNSKGRGP